MSPSHVTPVRLTGPDHRKLALWAARRGTTIFWVMRNAVAEFMVNHEQDIPTIIGDHVTDEYLLEGPKL